MVGTPEGIGSRKWSLGRDADGYPALMQGKFVVARLTEVPPAGETDTASGMSVKNLLVTAPQLWDAANELVKFIMNNVAQSPGATPNPLAVTLANMVAKSVGKTDWNDVSQ